MTKKQQIELFKKNMQIKPMWKMLSASIQGIKHAYLNADATGPHGAMPPLLRSSRHFLISLRNSFSQSAYLLNGFVRLDWPPLLLLLLPQFQCHNGAVEKDENMPDF